MDDLTTMSRLLQEVAEHLRENTKPGKTAAFDKLQRIAAIASTLAFTVKLSR